MAQRIIKHYGYETEDGFVGPDREQVRETLMDLEGSLFQLGGMFAVSVDRREVAPDEFVTVGVVIKYDSFAPAQRAPRPKHEEPVVETPEDLLDPVEDGIAEGATA